MRQILREAQRGGYGVGAFNVNNMEQLQAITEAAAETESPVIIQVSRNALKYAGDDLLAAMVAHQATRKFPRIPMALHLDHGPDVATCLRCIALGFTSVMIDGSLDYTKKIAKGYAPADFATNVAVTRQVVELAHMAGVTVEGEIGTLGGIEDEVESETHLTDPNEAKAFVEQTGVDALALAIGTSHGAHKAPKGKPIVLALDLIDTIDHLCPKVAKVMHGSSSVPQHMIDEVNKYGGQIADASGVPTAMIQDAIRRGMNKINIDTDGRLAITAAIRKVLVESPQKFDPRDYLGPARAAAKAWIIEEMKAFGTAGHAGDYAPMTCADMAAIYAK
jgi:fructose-bisphosphate aldolase, class II